MNSVTFYFWENTVWLKIILTQSTPIKLNHAAITAPSLNKGKIFMTFRILGVCVAKSFYISLVYICIACIYVGKKIIFLTG